MKTSTPIDLIKVKEAEKKNSTLETEGETSRDPVDTCSMSLLFGKPQGASGWGK